MMQMNHSSFFSLKLTFDKHVQYNHNHNHNHNHHAVLFLCLRFITSRVWLRYFIYKYRIRFRTQSGSQHFQQPINLNLFLFFLAVCLSICLFVCLLDCNRVSDNNKGCSDHEILGHYRCFVFCCCFLFLLFLRKKR